MAKVWVLDTETKGTGAHVVPLEDVLAKPEAAPQPANRRPRRRKPAAAADGGPRRSEPRPPAERASTSLPPGHVRKRSTGELGRVRAVDAQAGTATVQWLRGGHTSTVPLTAITRR